MKKIVCFAGMLAFIFALTIGTATLMAQTDAAKKTAPAATTKAAPAATTKKITHQTLCPVEGNKIDKKFYVDANGKRVYLCCPNCAAAVKTDPGKYISPMEKEGITVTKTPKKAKAESKTEAPKTHEPPVSEPK